MKEGWLSRTFRDVCHVYQPETLTHKQFNPGKYPVYGANGQIGWHDSFNHEETELTLGCRGSCGTVHVTLPKAWINGNAMVVRPNEGVITREFLMYALKGGADISVAITGTAQPQITRTSLMRVSISLPACIQVQQRIVALLDEAFEAIASAKTHAEQNLKNARALFESALNSVDGEAVALGDYVRIKTGKLDANAAVEGGEYPFFTCAKEIYAINEFAFDCDAILLAGNNAVGDFNVKHYCGKFNAYQRTYVITIADERRLDYRFLYFQMLSSLKTFKEQSVGAGTKFLKLGMIKDLEIALPSLEEQSRLALTLDSVLEESQRLEALYRRKIAALDELKASLLHKAFAGEL